MAPRPKPTEPPSKLAKYSGYAWCKHEVLETRDAVIELYHWARNHDWRRTGRILGQRRWWGWYGPSGLVPSSIADAAVALIAVVIILSAVLSSYHEQIARALRKGDHAAKIANAKWTWTIPVRWRSLTCLADRRSSSCSSSSRSRRSVLASHLIADARSSSVMS